MKSKTINYQLFGYSIIALPIIFLFLSLTSCEPESAVYHTDENLIIYTGDPLQYTWSDWEHPYFGWLEFPNDSLSRYEFWINGNELRVQGPPEMTTVYVLRDAMDKEGGLLEINEKNTFKTIIPEGQERIQFLIEFPDEE